MSVLIIILLVAIAAGSAGVALGWFLRFITALGRKGSAELEIKEMLLEAREEAEKISREAEKESQNILKLAREEAKVEDEKLHKTEDRLVKKESLLDQRQILLDEESEEIKKEKEKISSKQKKLDEIIERRKKELQNITNLSEDAARSELVKIIENQAEEDLQIRLRKLEHASKEKIEKRAKQILATTIQRLANPVSQDVFSSSINFSGKKDIKGKIIGKEGRNIKTFEKETGVELIMDENADSITLSSFDPIRREIAKVALERLIEDGRIQPAKIEREIEKARKEINQIIKEKGEAAAFETKVFNLDPRILLILGRLNFRTSYGQNVLQHSIEVAHLCGMIAEEIGANVQVARAGGLLHDIGKAVDHEVSGTHVEIGRRILQKFGASEDIVKAMQAHHEEYPYETIESVIVQVADSISGGRPGARRDSIELYLKRLEDLENIAVRFDGVQKAYALQAGREIRIFVTPDSVNDIEAKNMARDIAKQIEEELQYPGEIKVTLIRENRITEYAR